MRVVPHPSSVSLACARLGWPVEDVDVVSLVGRPVESLLVLPGRRVLVLSAGADTPARVAELLRARGFGPTRDDRPRRPRRPGGAAARRHGRDLVRAEAGALNVIALDCRAAPGVTPLGRSPGLPDDAFEHDGQLTKREVRAVTLAALAPLPGQLLWDVGAGSGSVAIEWLRTHPSCRAVAVESRAERAARITRNAARARRAGSDGGARPGARRAGGPAARRTRSSSAAALTGDGRAGGVLGGAARAAGGWSRTR